uniref:Uncharacterized protein n=1 Tax=Oryza glumipatula TaxID=40148 RepID=A0A0E0ASC2_9ORYZ
MSSRAGSPQPGLARVEEARRATAPVPVGARRAAADAGCRSSRRLSASRRASDGATVVGSLRSPAERPAAVRLSTTPPVRHSDEAATPPLVAWRCGSPVAVSAPALPLLAHVDLRSSSRYPSWRRRQASHRPPTLEAGEVVACSTAGSSSAPVPPSIPAFPCGPTAHRYHRSCRWLSPHALVNPARVSPALLGTRGATTALVTMGCAVVVLLEVSCTTLLSPTAISLLLVLSISLINLPVVMCLCFSLDI